MYMNKLKNSHILRFIVYLVISGFFFYAFYVRFWKYRQCINDAKSSCITDEGENLISGGVYWVIPAVIFLIIALRIIVSFIKSLTKV